MNMEERAHSDHHQALRLWLHLLTCTQLVEKQVRSRLREQFDTTLPLNLQALNQLLAAKACEPSRWTLWSRH